MSICKVFQDMKKGAEKVLPVLLMQPTQDQTRLFLMVIKRGYVCVDVCVRGNVYFPVCACQCPSQAANDPLVIRPLRQTQEAHQAAHRAENVTTAPNKNITSL